MTATKSNDTGDSQPIPKPIPIFKKNLQAQSQLDSQASMKLIHFAWEEITSVGQKLNSEEMIEEGFCF